MNAAKERALEVMNELHKSIPYSDYCTVMDGLQEIELLRDRDEELEELWAKFGDIPMNPKTECIEKPFMGWGAGIHREEIWHWFDKRYSKGVYHLLYGGIWLPAETNIGVDVSSTADKGGTFWWLKPPAHPSEDTLECESVTCAYNHEGECRFDCVHERKPRITEDDGCTESSVDPTNL